MKIYEIGTGYTPIPAKMGAATEIVVEELTRALIKNGRDAEIIDIKASNRGEIELPIREVGVPSVFTGTDVSLGIMHKLKRVVYSVCLARTLKKTLKASEEKVILHFHNQYNLFFFLKLVSKKIREKAIIGYTVHSYIWHGDWAEIGDTVNKKYFQELLCLKNADRIFVLNEKTRTNILEHVEGVAAKKLCLIDNGVNCDTYSCLSGEEKEEIKEKLGLKGKNVFVQVGSVCERKNQLESIRLLLPLMKQNENIAYCYMGGIISEEYQESIKTFAKENGISDRVIYCGEVCPGKELNGYYNIADAMPFPSKAEGFSLVVIEAMAAGVPVIINKELIFKLADDCLKYDDDASFQKLVSESILDAESQSDLSQKARKAALEGYSWDIVAEEYLKNFEIV